MMNLKRLWIKNIKITICTINNNKKLHWDKKFFYRKFTILLKKKINITYELNIVH